MPPTPKPDALDDAYAGDLEDEASVPDDLPPEYDQSANPLPDDVGDLAQAPAPS